MQDCLDWAFMVPVVPALLRALPVTLPITAVSMTLPLGLALAVALVRIYRVPVLQRTVGLYVSFMRGTPLLVQIYLAYYGLPRLLSAIHDAGGGTIRIGDLEVDAARATRDEAAAIRRRTAMVFQHYHLFRNRTALENVTEGLVVVQRMPVAEARARAESVLARVGLSDRLHHFPSQLSGGQQQRVGIARALALEPEVILLDEPTSALDPELVGEVLEVLRRLAREGRTMLVISHEMAFAREVASRVAFMDEGRIVEEGTAVDVFDRTREERTRRFLQRVKR
jgi:L-cystine transport system ATP-binding protein